MIGGLIVLVGILTMVMVHEGGHFLAAKATGMKASDNTHGFLSGYQLTTNLKTFFT